MNTIDNPNLEPDLININYLCIYLIFVDLYSSRLSNSIAKSLEKKSLIGKIVKATSKLI